MAVEQDLAAVVEAANALTATVDNKIQDIDQKVNEKTGELDQYLLNARMEYPFFRLTKNQFGTVTNGILDHYATNGLFSITFSDYRTLYTGTVWEERDAEERDILTAMGLAGQQYFSPDIKVTRMRWSGCDAHLGGPYRHTFNQHVPFANVMTCASYAKLLSGGLEGLGFAGITKEWGLCGTHIGGGAGSYTHNHPYATTPSGEVLFIWYASVSGLVPLDRTNPRWGFYPYVDITDVTI